jgi:hypothetical protein
MMLLDMAALLQDAVPVRQSKLRAACAAAACSLHPWHQPWQAVRTVALLLQQHLHILLLH